MLAKEKANLQLQLDGVNAKIVEYTQKLNSGTAASGGYADTIATLETKQATLQSRLRRCQQFDGVGRREHGSNFANLVASEREHKRIFRR